MHFWYTKPKLHRTINIIALTWQARISSNDQETRLANSVATADYKQ